VVRKQKLDKALELYRKGYSLRDVGDLIGVHQITVHRWLVDVGEERRSPGQHAQELWPRDSFLCPMCGRSYERRQSVAKGSKAHFCSRDCHARARHYVKNGMPMRFMFR